MWEGRDLPNVWRNQRHICSCEYSEVRSAHMAAFEEEKSHTLETHMVTFTITMMSLLLSDSFFFFLVVIVVFNSFYCEVCFGHVWSK